MNSYKLNFIYLDKTDLNDIIIEVLKTELKRKKEQLKQNQSIKKSKNRDDCL